MSGGAMPNPMFGVTSPALAWANAATKVFDAR